MVKSSGNGFLAVQVDKAGGGHESVNVRPSKVAVASQKPAAAAAAAKLPAAADVVSAPLSTQQI